MPENTLRSKHRLTPEMEAVKWKKGQTGNAGGRPKKRPITELYEEILRDPRNVETVRRAVMKALNSGQVAMLKEIADRLEGSTRQQVDHSGRMTLEQLVCGDSDDSDDSVDA